MPKLIGDCFKFQFFIRIPIPRLKNQTFSVWQGQFDHLFSGSGPANLFKSYQDVRFWNKSVGKLLVLLFKIIIIFFKKLISKFLKLDL